MGRKLTDDEKAKFHKWALDQERPKYPDAYITITVNDEIDDDGKVHYLTVVTKEAVAPPGWKSN